MAVREDCSSLADEPGFDCGLKRVWNHSLRGQYEAINVRSRFLVSCLVEKSTQQGEGEAHTPAGPPSPEGCKENSSTREGTLTLRLRVVEALKRPSRDSPLFVGIPKLKKVVPCPSPEDKPSREGAWTTSRPGASFKSMETFQSSWRTDASIDRTVSI